MKIVPIEFRNNFRFHVAIGDQFYIQLSVLLCKQNLDAKSQKWSAN